MYNHTKFELLFKEPTFDTFQPANIFLMKKKCYLIPGVHLGVKKMFNRLNMKYFWRGMYTDVVNFVKKCDKCSDQVDPMRGPLPPCPGGPTLGMAALGGKFQNVILGKYIVRREVK